MLNNKPHRLLWRAIPLVLLIGFLGWGKTVDIQLHDTYFVLGKIHVALVALIFIGFLGGIFFVFDKVNQDGNISGISALFSLISLLGIVLVTLLKDYINISGSSNWTNISFCSFIIIFFVAQFLLLCQVLLLLLKIEIK